MKLESTIKDPISENIVLFVNSISGGQSGKRFIDLEIENIDFTFDKNRVRLSIYDLLNQQAKVDGLERIRMESETKPVKVIVCGGDGTVLWVVEEIVKAKIDLENIIIGIIPIGTGNDFSRATGWGGEQTIMIGKKLQKLKQLVKQWMNAIVMEFDIWEVQISIFEDGCFKKGHSSGSTVDQRKVIKRCFSNYCSLGIDGRIGYSFDKFRSSSRMMNLAIYGGIGIQKSFKRSPPINKLVDRMYVKKSMLFNKTMTFNGGNDKANSITSVVKEHIQLKIDQEQQDDKPSSQQKSKKYEIQKPEQNGNQFKQIQEKLQSKLRLEEQQLQKQPSYLQSTIFSNVQPVKHLEVDLLNIAALNIQSYMGGVTNIWNKAEPALDSRRKMKLTPSSPNDGIIQIVGWKGETSLALQRFFNMAYKVDQGEGPFYFQFKHQKLQNAMHTYLQVDGQFWKVINPKQMIIRKATTIPGSRIKILRHR